VRAVARFAKIWVNIFTSDTDNPSGKSAVLGGYAAISDEMASFNIASLKVGQYYCGFFGYTAKHNEEVYLFYEGKKVLFSWDGIRGYFVQTD
jgi:hypothetical protein